MGYITGVDRSQQVLFPQSLDEYVSEENPVRFIDEFVASLDVAHLGFSRAVPAATGRRGFDPRDMLRLYLYGYLNKLRSSRRLEAEAQRNVELMWLLRKLAPDYRTIADFRKDHPEAVRNTYRAFVKLCRKLELLGSERVAVDGSKFQASNAREQNQTRGGLLTLLKKTEEQIERYLSELDEQDQVEEEQAQTALREKLKAALERKKSAQALLEEMKQNGETQRSKTDPESRSMPVRGGGKAVCFNVQIAVEEKSHLIVAYEVTNEVNDLHQLSTMAKAAKEALEVEQLEVVADAGYFDAQEIVACEAEQITPMVPQSNSSKNQKAGLYTHEAFAYEAERDVYVCPAGQVLELVGWEKHNGRRVRGYMNVSACQGCALRAQCTTSKKGRKIRRAPEAERVEAMRERMRQRPEVMRLRKSLVEHPLGTIKRGLGQGYFLQRGLRKVRGEFALSALAYNIKRAIALLGVKALVQALQAPATGHLRAAAAA